MSRSMSILAFGVFTIAVVALIGYYSVNRGTVELSAQCTENFNRFAGTNNNVVMELPEFLAYGSGISQDDFSRADADGNNALTIQEFCDWESTLRPVG